MTATDRHRHPKVGLRIPKALETKVRARVGARGLSALVCRLLAEWVEKGETTETKKEGD
jgi:hypothetical protein